MVIVTNVEQLHKPTEFVKEGDDFALIMEVVGNLFRELKEFNALGMAANQLGYNLRIFVMKMEPSPPICMINPVIVKEKGKQVREESCLSCPGKFIMVSRPKQIMLKGLNQYFKPVKYKLEGLKAQIACHEVDHLTGKLIIDYFESATKTDR